MLFRYPMLMILVFALLCACSAKPQLGKVEQGIYYQPNNWFACPLPYQQIGFGEKIRVIDAYSRQATQRRYNDDTRRYESVPVGAVEWLPSNKILFEDENTEQIGIEWLVGRIPEHSDAQSILTARHSQLRHSILATHKEIGAELTFSDYRAKAWLAQVPFLPADIGYDDIAQSAADDSDMGVAWVNSKAQRVQFYLNLVKGDHFVWITAKQPVSKFLSSGDNLRSDESVYKELMSQPQLMKRLLQSYLGYFKQCQFNQPSTGDHE